MNQSCTVLHRWAIQCNGRPANLLMQLQFRKWPGTENPRVGGSIPPCHTSQHIDAHGVITREVSVDARCTESADVGLDNKYPNALEQNPRISRRTNVPQHLVRAWEGLHRRRGRLKWLLRAIQQ